MQAGLFFWLFNATGILKYFTFARSIPAICLYVLYISGFFGYISVRILNSDQMARIFTTILLLIMAATATAQTTIRGKVVDEDSGIPIENANIVVKGTIFGAASDVNGNFTLRVQQLPVVLVVSEIRYQTKTFYVTNTDFQIRLESKVQMLEAVTIQKERIQNIHPARKYYAYDFEFYEDFIFVLAFTKSRKHSTLFILEDDGNIVKEEKLKIVPELFYPDFMGNLHLLTADSAFQVYYDYEKIHLLYSLSKWEFLSTMHQCRAEHNDGIIISQSGFRGLEQAYTLVDETGRKTFYEIADSAKRSYLEREYDLKYFLNLRNRGVEQYLVSVKTLRENLDFYRQTVATDWIDSRILAPVFAPLYKIDDTVHIFDYTHNEVIKFDDDLDIFSKTPIDFHQDKHWTKQFIIDETWQDLYTITVKDGITHIHKLDKQTFTPLETIKVDGHIHIGKIRIRNGHAYFLHKNHFRNTHRMIYRMGLW